MKLILVVVGLMLLIFPIFRHLSSESRSAEVETMAEIVWVVSSVSGGLTQGFFGLLILGFVCDCGQGYKPIWLFFGMAALGLIWCAMYPSGWLLGIPLILYSGEKLYRAAS